MSLKLEGEVETIAPSEISQVLLDHSANMIFVKDEKFRILYANQTFLNMYSPDIRDQIIGTTTIEKFSEEEAMVFLREDQKAFENGYAELVEELTDYQGVKHTYQTQKIRFTDKRGRILMLGICNEITKLAEREKALAQNNLVLENFAAIAAHDLRSPLGAYLSGIEIIKRDRDSILGTESKRILEMMRKSAEGLVAQIGNLMSAYKTSKSDVLELVDVDTGILLEEIKFNLNNQILHHGAIIRSSMLPIVKADRHFFRQLWHNLIENSLKYRSSEKPIIIIRYQKSKGEHIFSIEDNGVGIRNSNGNVFHLFEQANNNLDGLGIGLSLCKKIIELHKGTIWIDTTYKTGCKINFVIPE